jgi:DNA-directed RNA polymerase alpha subunit
VTVGIYLSAKVVSLLFKSLRKERDMMYYDPKQMEPIDDMVYSIEPDAETILKKAIDIYKEQFLTVKEQEKTIRVLKATIDFITNETVILRRKYKSLMGEKVETFEKSIEELELSTRVYNVFLNMNVKTLGDVYVLKKSELLRQPNFGVTSLREVKELMKLHGLTDWGYEEQR